MPQLSPVITAQNPAVSRLSPHTSNGHVVPVVGPLFLKRLCVLTVTILLSASFVLAQVNPAQNPAIPAFDPLSTIPPANPLSQPTLTPGVLILMELEGRFARAVAAGGGRVFATWFADDAVTLNNGRPAVLGRASIAAQATWDPKAYQLTWTPEGAQMGPSNDMGFTWGHYEGHAKDKNGQPVVTSGRYFTVWKKMPDGAWKVALDASANEPPATGECCTLPKP